MLDEDKILKLIGYLTVLGGVPMLSILFYIGLTMVPLWAFLPILPLFAVCVLLLIHIAREVRA